MIPPDMPYEPEPPTVCLTCDGPLDGNRWRCSDCVDAAEAAIRHAGGQVVTPSMIERERKRE